MLHPSGNGLNTVSCTGASFCMTVGHDTAEVWNGARRRTQKLVGPLGFGGPGVTAVSCVSRSGCMAVGNYLALDRSKQTAGFNVTEFWNGRRWRVPVTRNP